MVYTELAPRRQHFTWHQPCNNHRALTSTPLPWILIIRAIKGYSHSLRITCDMCAVSLIESREQRYIKAMNNNNNKSGRFDTGRDVERANENEMPLQMAASHSQRPRHRRGLNPFHLGTVRTDFQSARVIQVTEGNVRGTRSPNDSRQCETGPG